MVEITQEFLRSVFDFDVSKGILIWKERSDRSPQWNGRYAGTSAGSKAYFKTGGPYLVINILGQPRLGHRLIWIYLYGHEPIEIDHKNGDTMNNRPWNLRDATSSQNKANKNSDSLGYTKRGNRYRARIKVAGIITELGNYDTSEEAHAAYIAATIKQNGEYARANRFIRRF